MKILLATGIYPPELGGPATYTRGLALALKKMGHEVSVIAYGEQVKNCDDEFPVSRVSRKGGAVVRYLRFASRVFFAARKVDLVYLQGPVSEGLPATLGAKLAGRSTIMKIVGDYAWEMSENKKNNSRQKVTILDDFLNKRHGGIVGFYELAERWTARNAKRIIVPSKYLASVVEKWGVPVERIVVIKNAIHSLPEVGDRDTERQTLGVMNKFVALYVGRAVRWKGIGEMISWWKDMPSSHILVVAGDGPELENWKKIARKNGVEDRVRFLGAIGRAAVARWYTASDALVLPSAYEGYPHVVAEAASFGIPSFVSDKGGNPETRYTFKELVTVLPYLDREKWTQALTELSGQKLRTTDYGLRTDEISEWTFNDMTKETEKILTRVVEPSEGQKMNIVMVSYDKALLNPNSDVFERVSSLASEEQSISAIVISSLKQPAKVNVPPFRSQGFSGSSFIRLWRSLVCGIKEAKKLPGQTIITAQDPFVAGLVGYFVSRWTNSPLEIQEHGDFYSGYWVRESWKNRVLSWLGRFILKRAERVRAVSERVKQHLVRIGVDENRIDVICVAQDLFPISAKLSDRTDTSQMKLAGGHFRIVVPCRFVKQKGLDVLLQAAQILKSRGIWFELQLIGAGPLDEWLKSEIERQNLMKQISVQPWADPCELWEGADLFVLSSRYEGWGRTVVEAMAAGVPIVATNTGCVGSFLRPQIDGRVVEPNDAQALAAAISEQILEPERREAMRKSALKRANEFQPQDVLHEKQKNGWRALLVRRAKCEEQKANYPRWELWVAAFILLILISRIASVALFHDSLVNREWGFYTLVERWFQGYGYSFAAESGCASAYRSPGFLFFLTGLYTFFSPENIWAQAIVQNIFVGGALWLVYAVGKFLVGKRAALIGGILMAIYPYTFYHYTQYYHTFLSSFFLLLLVWFVLKLADKKLWRHAVGAGLSIGCLAYIQGSILPATPLIVAWLLYKWWPNWKRTLIAAVIMAVLSAGLLAPWAYRNYKVFNHFVPLTTDVGHALFKANNEIIYELTKRGYPQEIVDEVVVSSTDPNYKQYRMPDYLEEDFKNSGAWTKSVYWTEWHPKEPNGRVESCDELGPLDEYEFDQYWSGRAKDWIKTNWWTDGLKLQLLKLKTFWQPSLFPSVKTGAPWPFADNALKVWLARNVMALASAVVIFGGWLGIIFAIRRRDKNVWLPISIISVYTLLHTVIAGYTKYRIPLDNLMAVYAGWVIVALWDRIRGKEKEE